MIRESDIERIEINLLLEAIFNRYGYDFRHYAKASIKRRIKNLLRKNNIKYISELIPEILHNESFFEQNVYDFSITVTEMFRDPGFYKSLKEDIIPYLKTYPFIKVWHVGCATGEEVYSFAIFLKEAGLDKKTTIYATDFNEEALKTAKEGIYSLEAVKKFTANYQKAGGQHTFSDYYHAKYKSAIINQNLKANITFANHNLVTDGIFGEMHLIFCRNVLIYFDKNLQNRVLRLLDESIIRKGFLALGSKESLSFTAIENKYNITDGKNKIYQKKNEF
jgi:chemotaxis protein methyltransferase CheR